MGLGSFGSECCDPPIASTPKKLFWETPQAFLCVCFPEGKVCGVVRIYNAIVQRDCTLSF